ncbi:hypothetical protein SLS59_009375 [Nothophoma quercina]|uniref:Uncharacterized protein n=1 Tax=Nothophoma quercina TaxID=749835 RepID=A0ABR3QLM0_9PLEO
MDTDILTDVCNWIPTLMLDKSQKEKLAMYVQDLYAILHALWVDDTKPLHGFIRVQISLLLLLSAVTATRPGAIVESASAKGSNKALSFKNIEILKVRSIEDPHRSTITANVNLENIKNKERGGKPTYEKYYTPTHIARDFQSIYFGSPSEDLLIESVARMGLSRDRRAPTELDDAQQEELRNDPALAVLRKERETYKGQLHDQGFQPLSKGQGTDLYKKYEDTKRKIGSTYQRLYRERLDAAYNEFHESIDTIEIARQLSGKAAVEVLTLPAVEFELRERATIAGMLFKPIQDDKTRVRFVRTLARLCHKQETRQPKAFKRKNVGLVTREANGSYLSNKRKKGTDGVENSPLNQDGGIAEEELDVPPRGNILQARE